MVFIKIKGSMFGVLPENEYSITNLSKTHTITIHFVLIKYQDNEYYTDANYDRCVEMRIPKTFKISKWSCFAKLKKKCSIQNN